MDWNKRKALMTTDFIKYFDHPPTVWSRAPGRVDLMGSHTDYNEGYVMTMAIDRDTWIAARPRSDRQVVIRSLNLDGEGTFLLDDVSFDETFPWTNYVRGVAKILQREGYMLTGFEGLVHSTIPFGSGLSSSAALEVATATLFKLLGHLNIETTQLALLCQQAENEFVGVNCGILDQYSSALGQDGQTLMLDCRNLTTEMATLPDNVQVVICDTRAHRELNGSEYGERRAQCEEGAQILQQFYPAITALRDVSLAQFVEHEADLPEIVAKRCRFIIEENQRVLDLTQALSSNNLPALDTLTTESYLGSRDLYEIGWPEMETMMHAMRTAPGVIGARQAGGGFGGCMVAFVEADAIADFTRHIQETYLTPTGLQAKVYPVQAVSGAGPV